MHIKHWKVFAISLFILGTSATSWASAPLVEWSMVYGEFIVAGESTSFSVSDKQYDFDF